MDSEGEFSALISSESQIVRVSLVLLLRTWKVFASISDEPPCSLVDRVTRSTPDVVLWSMAKVDPSTVRILQFLLDAYRKVRQVVLLNVGDQASCLALLRSGASGIVSHRATPDELRSCLLKVCNGSRYVDPRLREAPPDPASISSHAYLELLSEREREVLELIALGYTQKEVAQRLRINRKSVETYRGRIATKLNLSSRADMVQFAFAAGVV